jgi:hypothetical protein
MSDRDTLDLEAELRHLSAQVDAHSRPIGAARAVTTARRRRAARIGGAVAAGLVVIVGATSWGVLQLPTPVPVTASPSLTPVQAPTRPVPLTAGRLQAATEGWVNSWQRGASQVPTALPCANRSLIEPEPVGITTDYRNGQTRGATHTVTVYSSVNTAYQAYMLTHASVDACPAVQADRLSYGFNDAAPGPNAENFVEVAVLSWQDGGSEGTVWIATSGNKTSVLIVAGVTDPPEPVTERIAEAVAADLLAQ